jgi:hypothetical protein
MGNVLLAGIFEAATTLQRSESGQKMVRVLWRTTSETMHFFQDFFPGKSEKNWEI